MEIANGNELGIDGVISVLVDGSWEKVDSMEESVFVGEFGRFKAPVLKFYYSIRDA